MTTISKEEFDALPESLKPSFEAEGDKYTLKVEDVTALKNAKTHEKEARQAAEAKLATFEAAQAEEIEKAKAQALKEAKENGDLKALEKSWNEKLAEKEAQIEAFRVEKESALITAAETNLLSGFADKSTSPEMMRLYIKDKTRMEVVDGEVRTTFLDANRAPTADSLEEFTKKVLDDPNVKPFLKGGKGSGSGAVGQTGGGASTKKLSEMTATEEATFANSDPSAYAAALESS